MGRIYLVRHGQTLHNRDRILQGPRLDGPLSDLGQLQAESLAGALAGKTLDAVYTSPMVRARETADVVVRLHGVRRPTGTANPGAVNPGALPAAPFKDRSDANPRSTAAPGGAHAPVQIPGIHGFSGLVQPTVAAASQSVSVQVVPELYEMDYGQFAGQSYDAVKEEMEQVLDAWRIGFTDHAFPGGESPVLAQHRIRPFATRALAQARTQDVAVVAHGRINRILMATWTGAGLGRLEEFPQANASLTELEVTADGVLVVRLNDTSHLSLATDSFA